MGERAWVFAAFCEQRNARRGDASARSLFDLRHLSVRAMALSLAAGLAACAGTPEPPANVAAPAPQKQAARTNAPQPHYKVGRPYKVNGRRYTPKVDDRYDKTGLASWYGKAFDGRPTANGERFDRRRLSAAHRTLPLPSIVDVENVATGARVRVRVNDRGPFVDDRIIDLSEAAAEALGFKADGLAKVRVRYIGPAEVGARASLPGEGPAPAPRAVAATPATAIVETRRAPAHPAQRPSTATSPATTAAPAVAATGEQAPKREIWLEAGAFATLDDAEAAMIALDAFGEAALFEREHRDGGRDYALRLGPYARAADAAEAQAVASARGFPGAMVLFLEPAR